MPPGHPSPTSCRCRTHRSNSDQNDKSRQRHANCTDYEDNEFYLLAVDAGLTGGNRIAALDFDLTSQWRVIKQNQAKDKICPQHNDMIVVISAKVNDRIGVTASLR